MNQVLKIKTDGGARGNPGPAAAAFVATTADGQIIEQKAKYIGNATNNIAEYHGVLLALHWLTENRKEFASTIVDFFLDSELVTRQLNGIYAVKSPELQILFKEARKLINDLPCRLTFTHIRRTENVEADRLVNETLDALAV